MDQEWVKNGRQKNAFGHPKWSRDNFAKNKQTKERTFLTHVGPVFGAKEGSKMNLIWQSALQSAKRFAIRRWELRPKWVTI